MDEIEMAMSEISNSSNSSNSSKGGGNTISPPKKQISPAKRWCFTLNNWTEEEYSSIVPKIEELCDYGIIGKEIGEEEKTPHLQGYLEFKTKKRPLSVFSFTNRIKWFKAKGNREDNFNYCSKDGDFWEFPKRHVKKPILIEEFYDWEKEIIEILKNEPDNRNIFWFWSSKGGGRQDYVPKMDF